MAISIGDVSLTLSTLCSQCGIQHPSVPCLTGPVWMVMTAASLRLWDLIFGSVFLESRSSGTTSLIWGGEVIWSAGMLWWSIV